MYLNSIYFFIIFFVCINFSSGQDQALQNSQSELKKNNALIGVPQELQNRCFVFFDELLSGKTDTAFSKLLQSSPIREKKEQLTNLISQVNRSNELYGRVSAFEPVSSELVSESLIKLRFLGLHDKFPLRWLITFYKSPTNGWIVINIKFDELSEYFFTDE